MKTFAKLLFPILALSQTVLASDITIKPTAKFDFSSGYVRNQGTTSNETVSFNRNNFGFMSQGRFILNVKNQLENNISYGAQVALQTSTRSDRNTPSHLFFESDAGKWELGSDKSVMTKMKITGTSHASATGGSWDAWISPDIRDKKIQYVTNPGNFLDTKARSPKKIEYSRKVSYFSPKISGFQFGVSYVPDTVNEGGGPIKDDAPDYHMADKIAKGYAFGIKDGIALGLTKEHQFNEKMSAKLSLVTEFGKVAVKKPTRAQLISADPRLDTTQPPQPPLTEKQIDALNPLVDPTGVKFKKLSTYNIGAEVKYGKFAISGCYSDFRKSLTANNAKIDPSDRKKSYLYNIGAKYSFEKISVSAHYFYSDNKKNTVGATTFAVDYKLAPGIMPYAEVTAFTAKGAYKTSNTSTEYTSDNHKGGLFLVGLKLEF